MATSVSLSLVCCLVILSSAALGKVIKMAPDQRGVEFGPRNIAVYQGASVTLGCVTDGVVGSNIRWYEHVTNPTNPEGTMISDGAVLIGSHPNVDRYQIDNPDSRTFNLIISGIVLNDGGYYECRDSNAAPPSIVVLGAELIVFSSPPICNQTYPFDTGATLEGVYHTIQCIQSFKSTPGVHPLQTWTGPPPFSYGFSFNNDTVWSGISFYASRTMDAQNWICKTNFTDDVFLGPNRDITAPTYQVLSPSNQIFVFWGPSNMTAYPIQASYEIGQQITCYADAWPRPNYVWQSLRTSESWYNVAFTTREDMVGYQLMRCQALNTISGTTFTRDFFLDVYVNPITTPTTTPTTQSTTTPPAWGDCGSLTGQWRSTNPNAQLCITVTNTNFGANIIGLYKNGTDSFWMSLTGLTRVGNSKTLAWTMIFPQGMIGVSSYAAECHSCFGTEQILANGISRTTLDSQFCGLGGTVNSSPQFTFYRVPTTYPCTANPTEMQERIALSKSGKLMSSQFDE